MDNKLIVGIVAVCLIAAGIAASDRRISHIRPRTRNKKDVAYFRGMEVRKVSFWLNDLYIQEVVRRNLERAPSPVPP